jgi:hypothetical protein
MKWLVHGDTENPWALDVAYVDALREIGEEVTSVSSSAGGYGKSIVDRSLRRLARQPLPSARSAHCRDLLHVVDDTHPDVCLILKGLWLGRREIDAIKQRGVWVANLNHDDFFSRNKNNWSPVQRSALPAYDHVFVTRQVNVEEVRPLNGNVSFIPFAYWPRLHRPVSTEDLNLIYDVVFVGTWEQERCRLLEHLVSKVPCNCAVWGNLWDRVSRRSPLFPAIKGVPLLGDDMARVFGAAKICLGFLRKRNRDEHTQRTFEIPACRGVLLAERTEVHQRLFRENVEAAFFDADDPAELVRKVEWLLADHEARELLRLKGWQRTTSTSATYADRVRTIRDVYAQRKAA